MTFEAKRFRDVAVAIPKVAIGGVIAMSPVAADPSEDEVNQAWGVPVLVSTQFTPGVFVFVDTSI
jgi:hypothetical protein